MYIKPGVDAARAARGDAGSHHNDGLATFTSLQEITVSRVIEMVCESIPSAFIQAHAFVRSDERTAAALMSICLSCCTTSYVAATLWYDTDTSPSVRRMAPMMAGLVPDQGRGVFFCLLTISGALQVVAKTFSSALLMVANPSYFLAYLAGDHVLYLLITLLRGDFFISFQGLTPVSPVGRPILKMLADVTGCWILR
jgi:hypothetical protein